jgi:DNA-binding HxlR family transcriptional regulator
VIRECFLGTKRFGAFQENLGIAPNILAHRLDRLVTFGVLVKTPYQHLPLRSEYRLTEKGLDLYCVPLAMLTWAQHWLSRTPAKTNLRHKLCGKAFVAVMTCATCGEPVVPVDIVLEPATQPDQSNAQNKVA